MPTTPSPSSIVLASRSPRRHELLNLIGLRHRIEEAGIDEAPVVAEKAVAYAERMAREKSLEVSGRWESAPVLGADTVVEVTGKILGKPESTGEAQRMLHELSGRTHRVHTAVALTHQGRCECLVDTATVHFRPMTAEMIRWYVATREPMDKAGAYAVQGAGGLFVDAVEGSPHTVIGLPIHRLDELWSQCGLRLWDFLG